MNTHRSPLQASFHGARSWWQIRSRRSGGMTTFHRTPGGGLKPAAVSCRSRNDLPDPVQASRIQRREGVGRAARNVLQHVPPA
jgi:hypothetical protein